MPETCLLSVDIYGTFTTWRPSVRHTRGIIIVSYVTKTVLQSTRLTVTHVINVRMYLTLNNTLTTVRIFHVTWKMVSKWSCIHF